MAPQLPSILAPRKEGPGICCFSFLDMDTKESRVDNWEADPGHLLESSDRQFFKVWFNGPYVQWGSVWWICFCWSVERWSQEEIKFEVIRSPNAYIGCCFRWLHFGMRIRDYQRTPLSTRRMTAQMLAIPSSSLYIQNEFCEVSCLLFHQDSHSKKTRKLLWRIASPGKTRKLFIRILHYHKDFSFGGFEMKNFSRGRRINFFNDKQKLKRSSPKSWGNPMASCRPHRSPSPTVTDPAVEKNLRIDENPWAHP